jgi:hypothetical protein
MITCSSASMRRSSMRGSERRSDLVKKEHKEEALHFGIPLHDDESLMVSGAPFNTHGFYLFYFIYLFTWVFLERIILMRALSASHSHLHHWLG